MKIENWPDYINVLLSKQDFATNKNIISLTFKFMYWQLMAFGKEIQRNFPRNKKRKFNNREHSVKLN